MGRTWSALAVILVCARAVGVAGCGTESAGTIKLVLALPPTGDLRPTGMATVAVGITSEDGIENVTTTPLDDMRFDAGDVPLGELIRLRVELRDNTNRLVAFGLVEDAILPDRSEQTITIPVRKPIIYMSSDRPVGTLDPTFDGLDPKFQGTLGATAGATAFAVDGSELAVISGTNLQRIATADHTAVGTPIPLGTMVVSDATRVPGERRLVVASSEGSAPGVLVVDLESGEVRKL
ncbi:MAG: hypothetical protein H0X17_23275, partial [Deltaproteobacteria bacterium]|nr:hypothetical protein [Deltaproteobacteria bacterium]